MLVSQVLNLTGVPFSRVMRRIQAERKSHYHRLHGFYPGVDTDMSADAIEQREFVHDIHLTDDAWAIGKALKDLDITRRRVDIALIRRGDDEFSDVHPSFVLQAQDTVVLQGKPRRVERIERYLQEGN